MGKSKSHHLITKSNELIEAKYRLGVSEQRLIALITSQVSPKDEDFKPYRFKVQELLDLMDGGSRATFQRIEGVAKGLLQKTLVIEKPTGTLWVNWFSSAEYYKSEGELEISFDPKLRPYLLQLKEQFTSYQLANVVKLKSRYSVRIYELLKQYERLGSRTIELPELREMLGIEKSEYARWADFKRWVITPAHRELPEKTDLTFDYATRKRARAVHWLDFSIRPSAPKKLSARATKRRVAEAQACWAKLRGSCAASWKNYAKPSAAGAACHWCEKFAHPRAEAAGQLRLID